MAAENHVHIIVTGGTIDSVFDPAKDSVIVNDHSVVTDYLSRIVRPHFDVSAEVLTLKDSRLITDNIRADMVDAIKRSPHRAILITHGTYTIPETAQYLKRRAGEIPGKCVVLTGSFYPIKGFAETDAPFNLGFAIASAFLESPGVYVAMNGRLFLPEHVTKNTLIGRFEEKK